MERDTFVYDHPVASQICSWECPSALSHSARTSCGFSPCSASADRAKRSDAITRSTGGDADVRASSASRSSSADPTIRRRERLIASASCLTTVWARDTKPPRLRRHVLLAGSRRADGPAQLGGAA